MTTLRYRCYRVVVTTYIFSEPCTALVDQFSDIVGVGSNGSM